MDDQRAPERCGQQDAASNEYRPVSDPAEHRGWDPCRNPADVRGDGHDQGRPTKQAMGGSSPHTATLAAAAGRIGDAGAV